MKHIGKLILLLLSSQASAGPVFEVEPNNAFATAQVIPQTAFTKDFDPDIGIKVKCFVPPCLISFSNNSTRLDHVEVFGDAEGSDFFRFFHGGGAFVANIEGEDLALNFFNDAGFLLGADYGFPIPWEGNEARIQKNGLPPAEYVVEVAGGGAYVLNISAFQIPEPTSLALFGAGLLFLIGCRPQR